MSSTGSLVFYALTGGGTAEWLRLQRNVRVFRMLTQIVLFASIEVAREMIRNKAANAVMAQRTGRR